MEQDIKQHTLTFEKGITSSPSDLLCDDDTLETCDGLTMVDGEWKPIQKPKEITDISLEGTLMCVHRGDEFSHYIYTKGTSLYYVNESGGKESEITVSDTFTSISEITSVGNILILNTDKGIAYILWKGSEYKYLGIGLPEYGFSPSISSGSWLYAESSIDNVLGTIGTYDKDEGTIQFSKEEEVDDFENAVVGIYAENINTIEKDKKGFVDPFFVCCAIKLYDGTYTMISQPILMLPSVNCNSVFQFADSSTGTLKVRTFYSNLACYVNTSIYQDYSDIVEGVTIFASAPIRLYKEELKNKAWIKQYAIGTTAVAITGLEPKDSSTVIIDSAAGDFKKYHPSDFTDYYGTTYLAKLLEEKDTTTINDSIKSASVFYKLGDIKNSSDTVRPLIISDGVIENLTTQQQLGSIDYYSHCKLHPEHLKVFNGRLNVFGIKRGFFGGFSRFSSYGSNIHNYEITVTIDIPSGTKTVVKNTYTSDIYYNGMWYFYPDPRATKLTIKCGSTTILNDVDLHGHTGLGGAYYYEKLPDGTESVATSSSGTDSDNADSLSETLNNYVIQSEVYNPFVFKASGYVRVGQGKIIGLSGLTTALSQDAYKVATTICFTEQGIWAMKIDSTGQYAEVPPPFSREVCLNAKSITMTDDAVFFVSKKGLMCVTGTTENSVICVSEKLQHNSDFHYSLEYDRSRIAYDYRNGLLIICNDDVTYKTWVYNIKNGIWSTFSAFGDIADITNDYPDTIIQTDDNSLYTLYNKDLPEDDDNSYTCTMASRALKLDGSLILKSIRQIKHLKNLCGCSSFGFNIEATNKLSEGWHLLSSVRGKAWRFFRFTYTFTDMKATDSFGGTVLISQQRHIDKLR